MRSSGAMARSVSQAFTVFLDRLVPSASERNVAAKHRDSVERSLDHALGLHRFKQTGSLAHGTGVTIYSDVDYLASLKGEQPVTSDTGLRKVKECLQSTFPSTSIHIDRPAVVSSSPQVLRRLRSFPAGLGTEAAIGASMRSWVERPGGSSPRQTHT